MSERPDTDYRKPLRLGALLLVVGLGGFAGWAAVAPLDEAIPAEGIVAVESNRKRIEHLSGGVVEQILVKDGDRVKAGDPLVGLNRVLGQSQLNAVQTQWMTAVANLARLRAERDASAGIAFPPELMALREQPEAASLMQAQEQLLRSRRLALEGELRIIRESVRGLETQLASLGQLKAGRETQIALFNEQLQSFRNLRTEGFVSRNNVLEIERQLAEVQSKQSEDLSNIAAINTRLAEFRMRASQREMEYRREVEAQMGDFQRDAATLTERLTAQQDNVERLVIRAPVAGKVVDLAVHTVGGVVRPGDRLMDLVPEADGLVVEARMPTQYVDRVHAGLPADVRFDAYADRAARPALTGQVMLVSADALRDERSGITYYQLRVTVPAGEARKLGQVQLRPGMPATVMVKTGERTLMAYLARPLLRRLDGAFSEH